MVVDRLEIAEEQRVLSGQKSSEWHFWAGQGALLVNWSKWRVFERSAEILLANIGEIRVISSHTRITKVKVILRIKYVVDFVRKK